MLKSVVQACGLTLLLVGGPALAPPSALAQSVYPIGVRPLRGQFNQVPMLVSNQPEIVQSGGVLISTMPGTVYPHPADRAPMGAIANPSYSFNGPFSLHLHHGYRPLDPSRFGGVRDRGQLLIGLIALNPTNQPIQLHFDSGQLSTSFDSPYRTRDWGAQDNSTGMIRSGPGDSTALALLRQKRDWRIPADVIVPPMSQALLFQVGIPARGTANVLARGSSTGPIRLAVVATEDDPSPEAFFSTLQQGQLAAGRYYLNALSRIERRDLFSRVSGVARGDRYSAEVDTSLERPLHLPLTTTWRKHFGTGELQMNSLLVRMPDSSLENVGTYGTEYQIHLKLKGQGEQQLVFSTPPESGLNASFRGTFRIEQNGRVEDVHVSQRAGESTPIYRFRVPGQTELTVRLVYPADATPGHLLSVVPADSPLASRLFESDGDLVRSLPPIGGSLRLSWPRLTQNRPTPETD
jgi:Protein of unknown function (DUF3370)